MFCQRVGTTTIIWLDIINDYSIDYSIISNARKHQEAIRKHQEAT